MFPSLPVCRRGVHAAHHAARQHPGQVNSRHGRRMQGKVALDSAGEPAATDTRQVRACCHEQAMLPRPAVIVLGRAASHTHIAGNACNAATACIGWGGLPTLGGSTTLRACRAKRRMGRPLPTIKLPCQPVKGSLALFRPSTRGVPASALLPPPAAAWPQQRDRQFIPRSSHSAI